MEWVILMLLEKPPIHKPIEFLMRPPALALTGLPLTEPLVLSLKKPKGEGAPINVDTVTKGNFLFDM